MKQYQDLIHKILTDGEVRQDRTGTGTKGIFGHQMRFDLNEGFPLVTTKRLHVKSIIHELLWMLWGDTNIKYLKENGVRIWNEWADENGNLGPVYGHQWRNWNLRAEDGKVLQTDQIEELIKGLVENPFSRRHIVTAWNPSEVNDMALPPCHMMMQFYVSTDGKLSCQMYQRSADVFLGVPFNIASYALLTHIIAKSCGLKVGEFVHTIGDAHIYLNHIEQCKLLMDRDPLPLPKLEIAFRTTGVFSTADRLSWIDHLKYEDFEIIGYEAHEAIKGEVSV